MIEFARAQAYKELFNLMETAEPMIKNISKQIKDPKKDYGF